MILVTGVTGFIGKHLLAALVEKYGSDKILALTSKPVKLCPYLLHNNYIFDSNYFIDAGYSNIKTIIHAGAFTPKSKLDANNWDGCNSNIINSDRLLKANFPELNNIVYLSTLDVYGVSPVISEQSEVSPASLYGASKLYCEKMIAAWADDKNCIHQVLRIGHVYGPGEENYQKIIPVAINKILKNEPVEVWGSGNSMRTFIYIDDVTKAIISSLALEKSIGVINLVGGRQISVNDLIDEIIDATEKKVAKKYKDSAFDERDFVFDNSKLKEFLLSEETSMHEGLVAEWQYMKHLNEQEHIL